MTILTELVDHRELNGFGREVYRLETLNNDFLSQFLPNVDNADGDLNYSLTRSNLALPQTAAFRAFDARPKVIARQGLSTLAGEIPALSLQQILTEEQKLRQRGILTGDKKRIIDAIFNDTHFLAGGIAAEMKRRRGELMQTGQIAINENGFVVTIDFLRDSTMEQTTSISWATVASATPRTDEAAWTKLYRTLNGFNPGAVIMSQDVVDHLGLSAEYRALAVASVGGTPSILTNDARDLIRRQFNLPPIIVFDDQVNIDGTMTDVIDDDYIIFVPPPSRPGGYTLHAATVTALELVDANVLSADEMTGIAISVTKSDVPVQTWTTADAIALPVAPDVNYFMACKVIL